MAKIHDIPLYVRDGKSDIQDDWNFACEKADTRLVTIAHQDDCYHRGLRGLGAAVLGTIPGHHGVHHRLRDLKG